MSATCLFSKQPATVALASESSWRGEKRGRCRRGNASCKFVLAWGCDGAGARPAARCAVGVGGVRADSIVPSAHKDGAYSSWRWPPVSGSTVGSSAQRVSIAERMTAEAF
jgi:hypothetical protein